jgi:hypothetical protein
VKYVAFNNGGGVEYSVPIVMSIDEIIGEDRTAYVTVNGTVFYITARDLMVYNRVVKTAMDQEGLDVMALGDKKKFMNAVHEAWAEGGNVPPPPGFEPFAEYLRYLTDYILLKSRNNPPEISKDQSPHGWTCVKNRIG